MSHYYSNDPTLLSNERLISFEMLGKSITLYTDNGVFSKNKLDEGTRILLESIIPLKINGNILDLGCGVGTIGLTLASFNSDVTCTLADVNLRALNLAKKNASHLGIEKRINVIESNVYSSINEKYDAIITNPPIRAGKNVTYAMYEGSKTHLLSGGSLYVVIRKAQGASSASRYIKEVFGNITLINREKGYYIYQAINN